MKISRILVLVLILAGAAAGAQEVRAGILLHDAAALWGRDRIERGTDINAELILGPAGWIRPHLGVSINSQGWTSCLYAGATLEHLARSGIFANLAPGLTIHNGTIDGGPGRNLGSRILFRIAAEVGYSWGRHRVALIFAHISNGAGIFPWDLINDGMDFLGIRWGFGGGRP